MGFGAGDPAGIHGADGPSLETWGVATYSSAISKSMSSSSSLLEEVSERMWALLPSELETCIFSWFPIMDQSELDDCSAPKSPARRAGMFMAREPTVGDEPGDTGSARVEWCRLVAAREKSRPRDRRGRMLGDAYVCEWSSLGDSGAL